MKRTLHIFAGPPTYSSKKCTVMVVQDGVTIHRVSPVNFGLAITNIMQEWSCSSLNYSAAARLKFLGNSSCNLDPAMV